MVAGRFHLESGLLDDCLGPALHPHCPQVSRRPSKHLDTGGGTSQKKEREVTPPLTPLEIYRTENPEFDGEWAQRYLLFLYGVTAVFDGFKALDVEALAIAHNELRVIIGPNGAGKSTMCDVITGKTRPAT